MALNTEGWASGKLDDENDKNSYLKLSTYNSFSNNKIQLINFTTSLDDFRADTNQQTLINLLLSLLFNFFYEDTTKKQAGKVLSFIIWSKFNIL